MTEAHIRMAMGDVLPEGCSVTARRSEQEAVLEIRAVITLYARATISEEVFRARDQLALIRALRKAADDLAAGIRAEAKRISEPKP
jgi:hypothetical protein